MIEARASSVTKKIQQGSFFLAKGDTAEGFGPAGEESWYGIEDMSYCHFCGALSSVMTRGFTAMNVFRVE